MSAKQAIKAKNMMYTQQMAHLPFQTIGELLDNVVNVLKPKKYALNIHDKDVDENGVPEEDHVHLMLSFDNARSCTNVAGLLHDKMQYIEAWKGKASNGYAYLVHATQDARSKYQYDPHKVIASFDYPAELKKMEKEASDSVQRKRVQTLLDSLYVGAITKEEMEQRLSGSQYARYHRQIEDIWNKYLENVAQQWREEMIAQGKKVEVIWRFGTAGTGKTSLAKEYAKKSGQEYFISGSSRDIFQKYKGEHTLILDELRPEIMTYSDMLRIFDPFGARDVVMAPSRYNDKALACDLILVTTPYSPYHFYCTKFGFPIGNVPPATCTDSFEQLLRRISLTIRMDDDWIYPVEYDKKSHSFQEIPSARRKNLYSSINYPTQANDSVTMFNAMFD